MTIDNEKTAFKSNDFDWESYLKFRPLYRDNLYNLVFDFHASQQAANFNTAWDAGCGIGNVSVVLATRFKHVWATDPSSAHIEKARQYVQQFPGNVSLVARRAEEGIDAPDGSVNLFTIAEALHWTNPQAVIHTASQKLCSGGTFAAWQYSPRCFFVDKDESPRHELLDTLWKHWNAIMMERAGEHGPRALEIMMSRFGSLDFDKADWEGDVQRWSFCPDRPMFHETIDDPIQSTATAGKQLHAIEDPEIFWVDADIAWITGYFAHLYPDLLVPGMLQKELDSLGKAMDDKSYKLAWPGSLVLARRK